MASKCKKCGSKDNYNFALNIELCNPCIGEELESLEAENKQAIKFLEEALPYITCENHFQSGLITAIGTFLQALKGE